MDMECLGCGSVTYNYKSFGRAMQITRPVVYGLSTYIFSKIALSGRFQPLQITSRVGAVSAAVFIGVLHGYQDRGSKKVGLKPRLGGTILGLIPCGLISGVLTAVMKRSIAFRPFLEGAAVSAATPIIFWGIGKGIEGVRTLWPHQHTEVNSSGKESVNCRGCGTQWDSNQTTGNKVYLAAIISSLVAAYGFSKLADGVIKGYKLPIPHNLPLKMWMAGTLASVPSVVPFAARVKEGDPSKKPWGWPEAFGITLSTLCIYGASRCLGLNLSIKQAAVLGGASYMGTMCTYNNLGTLSNQAYQAWPRLGKF